MNPAPEFSSPQGPSLPPTDAADAGHDCTRTELALVLGVEDPATPLDPELARHRDGCPRCGALTHALDSWPGHLARAPFATDDRAPAELLPLVMRRVAAEQAAQMRTAPSRVEWRGSGVLAYAAALAALAACWLVVLEPLARPILADYAAELTPSRGWIAVADPSAMTLESPRLADAALVAPEWLAGWELRNVAQRGLELAGLSDREGRPAWATAAGIAIAMALLSVALVRHAERRASMNLRSAA